MRIANAHYLIVDVEATCSDNGAVPRHEMEIIEIGAVMMAARTFEIESEFQVYSLERLVTGPFSKIELPPRVAKLSGYHSHPHIHPEHQ